MPSRLFQILFTVLSPFFSMAQDPNDETIRWTADRKLTWSDYKASPDAASDAAASTTTYLGIEYNIENNNLGYKITSTFSKTRSWGRHKDDYILSHEQGHWDIAEIFARKLHQQMTQYKFNAQTFKTELRKIYQNILDEKDEMQNRYDRETNHSIIADKQAEWIKKISGLLDEYKAFANY